MLVLRFLSILIFPILLVGTAATAEQKKSDAYNAKKAPYIRSCRVKLNSLKGKLSEKSTKICNCIFNEFHSNPNIEARELEYLIQYNRSRITAETEEQDMLFDYQSSLIGKCLQ